MKLYLHKASGIYDISEMVSSKKWGGEKSKAQRSLSFTFYKSNDIDIECFDGVTLYSDNNVELFQGRVYKNAKTLEKSRSIQAYDDMYYWVKNKGSYTFKNLTATGIFMNICDRFKIPYMNAAPTNYVVSEMNVKNRDLYSTMLDALSETFTQTSERFYIRYALGKANLIRRSENIHPWVIETGVNLLTATYSESAENLATQVRLTCQDSSKNTHLAIATDSTLISKFGLLEYSEEIKDVLNSSQLQERANALYKQKSVVEKTLSITCLGLDDVISGDAIYLNIPEFGISKSYYVDKDTHTFDDRTHSMQLDLVETLEI